MVPALLGLKGNLEMTLASRLSTHANLGHLDKKENCLSMIVGNMALIQVSKEEVEGKQKDSLKECKDDRLENIGGRG